MRHELSFFPFRGGDDAVAGLGQLLFRVDPEPGFFFPYADTVFYRSEGVKHHDMGNAPETLGPAPNPAR